MKKSIRFLQVAAVMIGISLSASKAAFATSFTINFDNLPNLPPTNQSTGFEYANGSDTLNGVTFNSNQFSVTGDQYRVDSVTPGPTFGVPHSGHYFLNNIENGSTTSAFLTTSSVLTEAWFGRNEYYGYGGGATSVTVVPLGANGNLSSGVTVSLLSDRDYDPQKPGANGLPGLMVKMDTSSFLNLQGITGYRIDRVSNGQYGVNWVADDFTFTDPAAVPEPGTILGSMVAIGFVSRFKQKSAKSQPEEENKAE